MQDLPALVALYSELDAHLETLRSQFFQNNDQQGIDRTETKQRLNDQSYFVLCWGQLEVAIDDVCRTAIHNRLSSLNWTDRRAWDLYNPADKRPSGLSFEDRVALILDRQGGHGSPWARVQFYYALRNQIAHGKLRPDRIDVVSVVEEIYTIQSALNA